MNRNYASSQIALHWLVFVAIIIAYAAMELKGLAVKGSPIRVTMAIVHYTAGFSVMLLMIIRVVLKMTHRDPEIIPPPPKPTDNFVDNVDNFLDYQTEQLDTFKTLLNDVYMAIPEILRLFLVMVYSGVWVSILIRSLRN